MSRRLVPGHPRQERVAHLTVPVAASTLMAERLAAGPAHGTVVVTGRSAAYVRTADGAFAVVATGAVAPSTSVVLPPGTAPQDVVPDAAHVVVGDGVVRLEGWGPVGHGPRHRLVLRPTRWCEPASVRAGRLDVDALQLLADALARRTDVPADVVHARSACRRAARELVAGRPDRADAHLHSVLGFGPGTTPSGDDAAAGVLLAAHALLVGARDRTHLQRLADGVVRRARDRTGTASQLMLDEARTGCGAAVVVQAVNSLTGQGDPRVAVAALLRLGHHSGSDIASGVLSLAQAVGEQEAE